MENFKKNSKNKQKTMYNQIKPHDRKKNLKNQ